MPGQPGEASSPSASNRVDGWGCQKRPNAMLTPFFIGVDTWGIYMRPARCTDADTGQWKLELLQCPAWSGTGAGQPQPAMLPPSNPSSCPHQPGTWSRSATHTRENDLSMYFPGPSILSLSPATGTLLPHPKHGISEVKTRPFPLCCRGSRLFSLMLWDLRIIWRLGSRYMCSFCMPCGCYTQAHVQFVQEVRFRPLNKESNVLF